MNDSAEIYKEQYFQSFPDEAQGLRLIEQARFEESRVIMLSSYRQPLRFIGLLLMRTPLLGRLFNGHLIIVVQQADSNREIGI